ncbi:MAG: aldehyde dehydrogenase family protein [Candidatus Aenigmarchaeota archaeon]|nr:aldehyde dehydrogenase family protein [Candidatus Aenigmarchaeota archaeon]
MIQSINPRTGKIIKIFSSCKKKDVHDAVKRSKIAQRNWADKKPEER